MRRFVTWVVLSSLVTLTWAASVKKTSTAKSSAKGTSGKKASARKSVTWRNRQTSPTQERYRQIQSALASKGYLAPEDATGVWNQASVEALKKFQSSQNIAANGKINSLSIIALGLGPKREAAPAKPPAQ